MALGLMTTAEDYYGEVQQMEEARTIITRSVKEARTIITRSVKEAHTIITRYVKEARTIIDFISATAPWNGPPRGTK